MNNILSIDFDFFQVVDKETIMDCYPDGIDLPTRMSTMIWKNYYENPRTSEPLSKVSVDQEKIEKVKKIIQKSKYSIGITVNSHRHIYGMIKQLYDPEEEISLYNLDMHHDIINENEELDCGNWVRHVLDEYEKTRFTWIANPISKPMYGLVGEEVGKIQESLDCLEGLEFDLIFLCRSDNWSPPHLDGSFLELANTIQDTCFVHKEEEIVLKNRYDVILGKHNLF